MFRPLALFSAVAVLSSAAFAEPARTVPEAAEVRKKSSMKAKAYPTATEAWSLLRTLRASEVVITDLEQSAALFDRPEDQPLTPDERQSVLSLWASLIDYEVTFDAIKDRFRYSWYSARSNNEEARAFVVAYAAYVGQQRASLAIVRATTGKPSYEKLLNEPNPEAGVGAGHLDRLKSHALAAKAAVVLRSGRDFLGTLDARFGKAGILEEGPFKELVWHAREAWEKTDKQYWESGFKLFAKATFGFAKDGMMGAVFPVQKGVAEWMGDTRVKHVGLALIKPEQLESLQQRMQPGDILVTRRNWYLSNIGLPGFWPHAELYIGTHAQMQANLDTDEDVTRTFGVKFTESLARDFPAAWHDYRKKSTADEQEHSIIEAVSEGIVFASIYEGALADYVGVMRPRLSKVEKAYAIRRAFSHFAKPYDFDFDFLTDSTLVCSELVYKAYQLPAGEGRSLKLNLSRVAGRTTMPVNEFIRKFDDEHQKPERQLDFVAFLDGRETTHDAVEADEAALRSTYKRVKWDLAQK